MLKRIFLVLGMSIFVTGTYAQAISVGSVRLEEAMRDLQLLDKIPQQYSFARYPSEAFTER